MASQLRGDVCLFLPVCLAPCSCVCVWDIVAFTIRRLAAEESVTPRPCLCLRCCRIIFPRAFPPAVTSVCFCLSTHTHRDAGSAFTASPAYLNDGIVPKFCRGRMCVSPKRQRRVFLRLRGSLECSLYCASHFKLLLGDLDQFVRFSRLFLFLTCILYIHSSLTHIPLFLNCVCVCVC